MSNRWTLQDLLNKGFNLDGEKATKENPKQSKYKNQKQSSGHDSKSERDFANLLKMHNIQFKEKLTFILSESFVYKGENILPIKMQPDFIIYKNDEMIAIVDTKHITGYQKTRKDGTKKPIKGTDEWRLKVKLLKKVLKNQGQEIHLFFPVSKKEKQETISTLLTLIQ